MATAVARPPGVYFDFVQRKALPQLRRSDVAGFVGITRTSPDEKVRQNSGSMGVEKEPKAFRCNRLQEFKDLFGTPSPDGYLDAAVRGFFANGGRVCWIARTECGKDRLAGRLAQALELLAVVDEVSLIVVPDTALLDAREAAEIWRAMILQAETLRDRTALLDPPENFKPQTIGEDFPRPPTGLAAFYWPWLKVAAHRPDARDISARAIPPCGHIAGTIARRDLSRGVFAPPANMVIEGALGVTDELSAADRDSVNENGINVIVAAPGRGTRAMGARTLLADRDDPYRWLNVRRLVAHLAEWIAEDTQWTVFEPQGEVLYRAIERSVRTILFDLWRRGGLVGETDDEAYFVRCDATTNPPDEAERGRVVCLVGLRPAVPAEMIVVRIGIAEGRVELLDREFADA